MVKTRYGGNGKRSRHRRRSDVVGFSLVNARISERHSAAISNPRPIPHKRALRFFLAPLIRAYGVQPFGQSKPAAAGYTPRSLYPSSAARAADRGEFLHYIRCRVHDRVENRKELAYLLLYRPVPQKRVRNSCLLITVHSPTSGIHRSSLQTTIGFKLLSSNPAIASVRQLLFEYHRSFPPAARFATIRDMKTFASPVQSGNGRLSSSRSAAFLP